MAKVLYALVIELEHWLHGACYLLHKFKHFCMHYSNSTTIEGQVISIKISFNPIQLLPDGHVTLTFTPEHVSTYQCNNNVILYFYSLLMECLNVSFGMMKQSMLV